MLQALRVRFLLPLWIAAAFAIVPPCALAAAHWRAGAAKVDITPQGPVWLAGYAARREPSNRVAGRIYVKALALEDAGGRKLLCITSDLLTMPRNLSEPVARTLAARFALPRAAVMLTASHSHSAPVIEDPLLDMYLLDEEGREKVRRYTERVREAILEAAERALSSLREAKLGYASGEVDFARNRRPQGGPVDHDVPVLQVQFTEGGAYKAAVLFVYACHNTTLQGLDLCGDYAGFAQEALEARHPGWIALFASGCGGDQNPHPRGTLDLAREHGRSLAEAVEAAIGAGTVPIAPQSGIAFGVTPLPLVAPPAKEEIEAELHSPDVYRRLRAKRLLERLERDGRIDTAYPYPAQVWRLGRDYFLVALAGEVVVEYALRLKKEVPEAVTGGGKAAIIAYANDVPGYIPSEKVLREGGYEGGGAMVYYQLHGPWAAGVEERVVRHVLSLARDTLYPSPVRARDAVWVKVWGEGAFTEGPAAAPDGSLYFSDIPNNRILRLHNGNVFEFRHPSGKANGLIFDAEGRLIACEGADGGNRRVSRTEPDGSITVLADRFRGRRLNSPNDVAIDPKGRIYFSDPRYAGSEARELDVEGVYRIDAPGTAERIIDDLVRPNGLAVSPRGKTLYVSDAGAARLYAYRLDESGQPSHRRLVFDFSPGRGIDGMEVDQEGTIFAAAGRGPLSGIYVLAPDGTLIDFLPLPETATNCSFGGTDARTLFATAGRSLYAIEVRRRGVFPWSRKDR